MQLQVDGASPWATLRKAPPASMVKRASVKLGAFSDKGMPGLGAPTESDQAFDLLDQKGQRGSVSCEPVSRFWPPITPTQ